MSRIKPTMTIQLTTLGGLHAVGDDGELDWLLSQRLRAALFVYLAVEQRVARESAVTIFWPESDQANARHALRQSLYLLRKSVGDDWLEARTHELRVRQHVGVDVHQFLAALERGEPESAARLYHGPFLGGVHLADLRPWESWVDDRRTQCARAFRKACRDWLGARKESDDWPGAIEAAQRWVAPDPHDDEAQHRLIETLADAGERAEAIRQYETYARLLAPDGLRPLDETTALVERVRSEPVAWPEDLSEATALDQAAPGPERSENATDARQPAPPAARPGAQASGRRRPPRRRFRPVVAGVGAVVALLSAVWLVQARWTADPQRPLRADGTNVEGERLLLAQFAGPTTDPALGSVVTDALRTDLLETEIVQVLDASEVRETLQRMQVRADAPLTAELAREVALRDGVKAVLEGEVAQAGTGYLLTAALRSTTSDRILAAFRETARDQDDVVPAIDRLSRQIRQQAGESLLSVEEAPELERVTTSSLDALRAYSEAARAFRRPDQRRVVSLVEEALELDPEFAMAWRLLSLSLSGTGWDRLRNVEAATRAYQLRYQLRPRERDLAAATYHNLVTHDLDAAGDAYQRLLDVDPNDRTALNNLGLVYREIGDLDAAAELFRRAVDRPDALASSYFNLVITRLAQGRLDEAWETVENFDRYPPHDFFASEAHFWVLLHQGEYASAFARIEPLLEHPARSPQERAWVHDLMARLALWRGRLAEARDHMAAAERMMIGAGRPHNPFVWRLRHAHAEVAVVDAESGVRLLRQGIEEGLPEKVSAPDRFHSVEGFIFGLAERPDDAEAALRRFEAEVPAELHPGFQARNASVRALVHLGRGDPEEAVRIIERVRASNPCRSCFASTMGWALREAGRLREAAQEWEAVVAGKDVSRDLGFDLAERLWAIQRLPQLYEDLGDTAAALRHYRRLVELWQDADPELQPRVEHARRRIAALEARGG